MYIAGELFGSNLCCLRFGLGCHIKLRSVLALGVPHILLRRFVKERPVAPSPPAIESQRNFK